MKLIDAIRNVDRTSTCTSDTYVDWTNLCNQTFDFRCGNLWSCSDEIHSRLKQYWIYQWLDGSTRVGCAAIWFDDRPVGYVERVACTSDSVYRFINATDIQEIRKMFVDLITHQLLTTSDPGLATQAELDCNIKDSIVVTSPTELASNWCIYETQMCRVIDTRHLFSTTNDITIELPNGTQLNVPVTHVKIPHNTTLT